MENRGQGYQTIAYEHIQERRAIRKVPCGPGGVLHDYVPFYFAPRSPMLYTIDRGNVEACPGGQSTILHLVSTIEAMVDHGLGFAFTDGHAIILFSQFFDDLNDLDKVDWETMRSTFWFDTDVKPDRNRRRQAEFLIHRHLPWSLVQVIGVFDQGMKHRVEGVLADSSCQKLPVVEIHRERYY
jgi:hypothetical protein